MIYILSSNLLKIIFSAWGDGVFLGIQTLAIAMLVMYYNGQTAKASAFLAAYTAVIAAVFSNSVPLKILWVGQTMVIPILLVSRVSIFIYSLFLYEKVTISVEDKLFLF